MLNRLPAYFLLLGLACQIGYAQRSGASFSILSESTGPLVADGNTTTTAFSQMGATEASQGTFSSATTGVTGTIGFLSQQSSSSVDPASSFTVSGGQSGAPYYQFIDGNGQTPDFTSLLLNPGKSYKFTASGVSNSHPFMIGESYGDMNSSLVNGGPLSGSGGSITVTIPIDFNGSLYYFCTNHNGMFQEFSIQGDTLLNDSNFQTAVNLWFDAEANATAIYGHISDWNTSAVTDMSRTFRYKSNFNEDISRWDVSAVTDMNGMFFMAGAFNQPIGDWNVSSVTNMQEMFDGAGSFNQPIGNWDLSSVTNIRRMLRYASGFNQPIGNWDVSAVTKMDGMFFMAVAFNQPIGDWNVSSVTNMQEMFDGAGSFNQPIGNWNVKLVTNMHRIFRGTYSFDQDISDWNVSGATTMAEMFVNNNAVSDSNKGLIHQSFSSNANWPYDWSEFLPNSPPSYLNPLSPLTIAENQPIGTVIGEFNATDLDAGATLTYSLVSGVGDGNNSLFTLETNGTLKTATTFDYESNASTYSIRVQAKDEYNASVEGNFTVTLTDNRELRLIADYHEYASQSFNSTMSSLQQVTSHSGSSPFLNGGERFVAVGDLFFHNNASSSDGINWTPFITNHNHWLNGVGYGGGLYMITAAAGQLFTSADGINFTKRTTPDSDDLTGITYGNGVYLIRKYWQAGKMLASNDGISWTTRDTLSGGSADKNNNNISGGNGYLVFVVPEGVRVSQDGISWNFHPVSHPYSSVSMPSVSYHKDAFYTVSTDAPDANAKVRIKVGRSLNGSSWNFNDFLVDSNTSLSFKGVFKDQFLFYGSDSGTGFQQFVLLSELSSLASVHKVTSGFPQEAISKMAIGKNRILFNTSAGNYVSEWVESQNQNIGVVGNAGTGARIAEIEFSGIQDLSPYTFTLTSLDHNNAASYLSVNGQYELVLSKSIPLNTMNMLSVGILGTSSAGASVYGEFLLPVTYSNDAPTDLNATAPLSVAENQPIGTIVGEFNATDPDANATLTYQFISGAGDGNNSLFTLETNGTLKTATTFDYETNASTYSIRVQAKDEFNATVEGNFTVMLTDLNEPVSHGIKDGLALYYSFDETNGSLVGDGSSNLRNGNLINGTLNTSGKFGSGVEFDNLAHAKIDLGVNQLALPNNWTISTWFTIPLDDTFVDFRHALTSSGTNAHVVLDQAGSKDLGVFNGTFSSTGFGATSLASGWHHIVARGSGEQTSFWIDGVAVGTVNAKVVSAVEVVGNLSGGFGRFSDKLDDFRIYDRALSGTEVIILYGGGNGDFFPYDIQLSNQVVLENSAVGTIIGQVGINSASHSPYQFTLIGGKGDSHNSFFQLDGNGTLKTNSLIDYESHPNLSFRVNVRDKDNRNLEKYFNVQVTDVLEYPIYSGFDGNGSTQITVLENTRNIIPMPFSYPPDGNLTFTIGGVDALRFEPVGNQGFRFIGLPDFEFPLDQGGDNVYDLNLTASYPNNLSTSRLLSVQVLDANETSWTFTNASATGRNGPTQVQLDLAYANTPLEGKVTSLQGIQQWTPPGRGTYYVRAFGGAGSLSGSNRGKGALVAGKFTLEHNDTVTMAIGQLGTSTAGPGGGGGGGSFFVLNGVPMLIAGGGGGHGGNKDSLNSAAHAPITENGLTSNNSYQGGTQGNGGNGADAGGGGGFLTDGQNGSQATGGKSFVNGAQGGYKTAGIYGGDGGFGGGGGGKYKDGNLYGSLHDGGGGGGYSGGGGGVSNTGGGGGSYNIGLDPLGLAGHHSSHGYIEITLLAESSSLSDLNSSAPLTIAENQPVGTIVGEFNATDSDANASLTYYLVSGAGDGNNSLFSLDTNGTLKTATVFDYETNASTYSIRVQAKDEHNATVEGNFTVTLTDVFDNQAPGAISIQFASLTENQPIGTVVGKLNAVDPEAGVVRYALINGSGSSGNQFFTVDPTGVLRTAVVFDFEQNASHSIRARAMDEFNASREEVLNIQASNQWEDPDGDGLENSYDPDDDNDGFSDIVEIAYGSDPLDPNSLPNRAPSEISLSPDRVEENMPIGTIVGQLRTIDGDDPNGTGVYQYSFITNSGAEFFSIDSNGTMLTKQELDFESNSSHRFELRVTDNLGAHLDQNLTIQVVDTFIPIVETGDPVDVGFQEAMLSGKLLDKGSSMDLIQIGMLVSTDPNPNLNTKGIIWERGFLDANQTFEVMMMGLEKGTKYFYRTYAMNAEGVGYGVVKDFVMQEHARGPSWAKAQPGAAANWWTSPWFGSFLYE